MHDSLRNEYGKSFLQLQINIQDALHRMLTYDTPNQEVYQYSLKNYKKPVFGANLYLVLFVGSCILVFIIAMILKYKYSNYMEEKYLKQQIDSLYEQNHSLLDGSAKDVKYIV